MIIHTATDDASATHVAPKTLDYRWNKVVLMKVSSDGLLCCSPSLGVEECVAPINGTVEACIDWEPQVQEPISNHAIRHNTVGH